MDSLSYSNCQAKATTLDGALDFHTEAKAETREFWLSISSPDVLESSEYDDFTENTPPDIQTLGADQSIFDTTNSKIMTGQD